MIYISMQVETVSLKAGLEDWEINFIQGIVNQLQIDFRTSKWSSNDKRNQMNASYKMMEVSVCFQAYCCLPIHLKGKI
jgi:hypothetical protein